MDTSAQPTPPPPAADANDRRRGAWFALAIGDALGAPIEAMRRDEIRAQHGRWTEMAAGGPRNRKKGEWTDATALAVAAAQAYAGADFDLDAAARAMVSWFEAHPKEAGGLTALALRLIQEDHLPPLAAGREALARKPGSADSGALMRAAPTGLVRAPDDPRLVRESGELCQVTHAHALCQAACATFNRTLASLVHQGPDVAQALTAALAVAATADADVHALVKRVRAGRLPLHLRDPAGSILACLEQALIALRDAPSLEQGLVEVANQGGDTNTNGAVAGALLGARFGCQQIPKRWLEELLKKGEIERALEGLERFCAGSPSAGPNRGAACETT